MDFVAKHTAIATICAASALVSSCYATRPAVADGSNMQSTLGASAAMAATAQAAAGSASSVRSSSSNAPAPAPAAMQPAPAPAAMQASAGRNGTGGCGAVLPPGASVSANTSAFQGLGGAGFSLVGICDRCGWDHKTDVCRSLVYSVPTISGPGRLTCGEVPFAYVHCLESNACICDGVVPEPCRDFKAMLDTCTQGP